MSKKNYRRYHIDAKKASNLFFHPQRFCVKVNRLGLAKLLIKEFFHYKANKQVILSRPCVYGVFSGPLGGFAPRENLCVGCLRCTTEHPEFVQISHNPQRNQLGDSYFTPDHIDTIIYEAETGRIPIKGAGYRGKFGGDGWDGMWTDMSEIVRPTRDGIHGREFISTEVDLGEKPPFLKLNNNQSHEKIVTIPLPILFDQSPMPSQNIHSILAEASSLLRTFAIIPFRFLEQNTPSAIPLISPDEFDQFCKSHHQPHMIELSSWHPQVFAQLRSYYPQTLCILRSDFNREELLQRYRDGVRIFHLTANYHGKNSEGRFILDLIREAHLAFVQEGCRDQVTLIGCGGIIAAEHMAKAIICGLDAIVLDTPVLAALQAKFEGECIDQKNSRFLLPPKLPKGWGAQRLINLAAAWQHQLLEILGAMGLREVRRMRGEIGRAMFQKELEKDAFAGIFGYEP